MKDHTKNIIILILACLVVGFFCFTIGCFTSLNWAVKTAHDVFGLNFNMSVDYSKLGEAMWRFKGSLTSG